jgi:hypothetical protein
MDQAREAARPGHRPGHRPGQGRPGQAEVVCWSTGRLGMSRPVCTVCACNLQPEDRGTGAVRVGSKEQSHEEEQLQNSCTNKRRQVTQTGRYLLLVETIGNVGVERRWCSKRVYRSYRKRTEEQVLESCN